MKDNKKTSDAKETTGNAKGTDKGTDAKETPIRVKKLNADSYVDTMKTFVFKPRVETEEREEKPRLIHLDRRPRESDGYFNARGITFRTLALLTGTGKEHDTPQKNAVLLMETLNAKLPKEKKLLRFSYVAKTFQLRFYPSDLPKDTFIAVDVSRPTKPETVLTQFGIGIPKG